MFEFEVFAQFLEKMSAESSRNKITSLAGELFDQLTATQAKYATYLLLGELGPAYQSKKFNLATKQVLKIVVDLISVNYGEVAAQKLLEKFQSLGDIGQAVYDFYTFEVISFDLLVTSSLSLEDFFQQMEILANISGIGSVLEKKDFLCKLLTKLSPLGQKYCLRILVGSLKIGISVGGILESFSMAVAKDKSLKELLEKSYNVHADLGMIIYHLKSFGISALDNPEPVFGMPVVPAAAERVESVEELVRRQKSFVLQPKLDGLRIQVHKFFDDSLQRQKVTFFSRNLLAVTEMFPELEKAFLDVPLCDFIVEGEVLSYDETSGMNLNFQATSQRRRKHEVLNHASNLPIRIFLFDILRIYGKSLIYSSYNERRMILEENFSFKKSIILITPEIVVQASQDSIAETKNIVENFFNDSIEAGYEGLMAKRLDGVYQAGKRGFNWIKIKQLGTSRLGDTIDAVVVGFYSGLGRRASLGIGALLTAVFNPLKNKYQTIAKVGSGLSDQDLQALYAELNKEILLSKPENLCVSKSLTPVFYVQPKIVVELDADEITFSEVHTAAVGELPIVDKGLALRFPRVKRIRRDKSVSDATTSVELKKIAQIKN